MFYLKDVLLEIQKTNNDDLLSENASQQLIKTIASKRLNCSDDAISPVNRYHCLPAENLTTFLEFCYNRTRPQVVNGT